MPTWNIRTRDDKGNTEIFKVRAESAAAAVRFAEVDLALVYSIENELGTGRGKYERSMAMIPAAVSGIGHLFVYGVIWKTSEMVLPKWSDINTLGHVGIIIFAVIMALGFFAGFGCQVYLFVQRRKNGGAAGASEQPEVLLHKSTNWQLHHYLLQHPIMRVMHLLTASVMGLIVVWQLGGEEAVDPFLIVMPLVILYIASLKPFSEQGIF